MENSKIAYVEYEMEDGETVLLSAAPILMLKLRNTGKHKTAYKEMSKTIMSKETEEDIIGIFNFLYGAYLCANMNDDHMEYTEFLGRVNADIEYNTETMTRLLKPQKKPDSELPSKEQ